MNMKVTSCQIELNMADEDALLNSDIQYSNDSSLLSDTDLIKYDDSNEDLMIAELNNIVLDGSKNEFNKYHARIGYLSDFVTSTECKFDIATIPTITVDSLGTSTPGIEIDFIGIYPYLVKLTWFDSDGNVIASNTGTPTSLKYYVRQSVNNYYKLEIKILETYCPNQLVKIGRIYLGKNYVFFGENLKSAKIYEEINRISDTLPANSAKFEIMDFDREFDILNDNGLWKYIKKNQKVVVNEIVDGTTMNMGTFYIDNRSFSDNKAELSCVDLIGFMDQYTFYDGKVYNMITVEDIVNEVFIKILSLTQTKISIADELKGIQLSGWLGVQSYREVLQMICFAIGAYADDSRSDVITIKKIPNYAYGFIGPDRKFINQTKMEIVETVNGVSISCNKYILDDNLTEVYNGKLSAGSFNIVFNNPVDPESIETNCPELVSIPYKKTNYISGICYEDVDFIVKAKKYSANTVFYNTDTEGENVKFFEGLTLYNEDIINNVALNIRKHYQNNVNVDLSFLLDKEKVGDSVYIVNTNDEMLSAVIENQSIDLTGGFISKANCKAFIVKSIKNVLYAGNNELYAAGNEVI